MGAARTPAGARRGAAQKGRTSVVCCCFLLFTVMTALPGSGSRLGFKLVKEIVGKPSAQKSFVIFLFKD